MNVNRGAGVYAPAPSFTPEDGMELKWEDPPSDGGGKEAERRNRAIVTQLRAHPGKWAVVKEYAQEVPADRRNAAATQASRIRTGMISAFRPAGSFEARSDGGKVYARYVGED